MKAILLWFLMFMSFNTYSEEIYRMETKIGNNQFNDLLVIDYCKAGVLKGSVTVPGNFSSPLVGTCHDNILNFKIVVNENGYTYYVDYMLNSSSNSQETLVTGKMMSDGVDLGLVQGKRIFRTIL